MSKPTTPQPSAAVEGEDIMAQAQTPEAPRAAKEEPALRSPEGEVGEAQQWKDKAYRAAAELENYRKRAAQDAESARLYAAQSFARDMLTVADNLDRALQTPENEANKALLDGVRMVQTNLQQTLKRHGVALIVVKPGDALNPDLHQVMNEVEADIAPGHIVHELQPGYTLNGRLLRPTFVSVAAQTSKPVLNS